MLQLAINFFVVLGFISVGYLLGTARSSRRIKGLIEYNNQKVQECRDLQSRCTWYKVMINGTYGVSAKAPSIIQSAEDIQKMNDAFANIGKA